jgi:hypothetical protein
MIGVLDNAAEKQKEIERDIVALTGAVINA